MQENEGSVNHQDWQKMEEEEDDFVERWMAWAGYVEVPDYFKTISENGKIQESGA